MSINRAIFRQYDVRGVVGTDLTEEVAYGIGRGYAALLAERGIAGAVAVGVLRICAVQAPPVPATSTRLRMALTT